MSVPASSGPRRPPLPLRILRSRPRLFLSAGVGVLLTVALAGVTGWKSATAMLVGWDGAVVLYLALVFRMMAQSDSGRIRRRAVLEDEGQATILVLTVTAALASLVAIFLELGGSGAGGGHRPLAQLLLAALTVVLSWTFVHTIFALHYAHEYYDETDGGGLAFPGAETEPDYWDFVYFSFVIGMTSQVSDVGITRRGIRRTAAAHGVVSFFFNATLLALTVNLAASAI